MPKKSPIRVRCKPLLLGIKRCRWEREGLLRAAEFTNRRNQTTAIVHPSTKTKGFWQVSFWDDQGPISDVQRRSCNDALAELPPKLWRLRQVE